VHRLKMTACELARRVLWRWWPHAYMANLPGYEPLLMVHAGGPRRPDMATINRSSVVLECTIMVGRVVQTPREARDGISDG
jgi:hypothetical protein